MNKKNIVIAIVAIIIVMVIGAVVYVRLAAHADTASAGFTLVSGRINIPGTDPADVVVTLGDSDSSNGVRTSGRGEFHIPTLLTGTQSVRFFRDGHWYQVLNGSQTVLNITQGQNIDNLTYTLQKIK